MTFSGVELLEVVPITSLTGGDGLATRFCLGDGGNKGLHISLAYNGGSSGVSRYVNFTIIDFITGSSLLYQANGIIARAADLYVTWDENLSNWAFVYTRYPGAYVGEVFRISTNGDYTASAGSGNHIHGCIAANSDGVYCCNENTSTVSRFLKTDGSWTTDPRQTTPHTVISVNDAFYGTDSSGNLFSINGLTDVRTQIKNLGVVPNRKYMPIRSGNWIWWVTTNSSTPLVGWNYTTDAVKRIPLTPTTPLPIFYSMQTPAILDNVAYLIASDNTKMVAIDLGSGRWKVDDLPTVRTGRYGVVAANGKLWIPSTVTPP